jgi:hypothetical protein
LAQKLAMLAEVTDRQSSIDPQIPSKAAEEFAA